MFLDPRSLYHQTRGWGSPVKPGVIRKNIRVRKPCVSIWCMSLPKGRVQDSHPWGFPGRLSDGEGAVQMMAQWFLMLQGADQNHKCFSRNPCLSENVRGAVTEQVHWYPYTLPFLCLCRYYGLSVWFPDVIKHLQSNVLPIEKIEREKFSNLGVNFTMANQLHMGAEYENGRSGNFKIT